MFIELFLIRKWVISGHISLFAAKEIKDFYLDHCPKIFPQASNSISIHNILLLCIDLSGPKYDGKYLHDLLKERLWETKWHETLTNVVIPTFDVKLIQPTIFSSYEVVLDAFLGDTCRGTSAAPTYLPAHLTPCTNRITPCPKCTLPSGAPGPSNYACMQDDTFTGELSSVDMASDENLQNLVRVGEELLKKPVSRVNLQTGAFEPLNKGTNEDALKRLAETLSKEKRLQDVRSPNAHVAKRGRNYLHSSQRFSLSPIELSCLKMHNITLHVDYLHVEN
ncbi:unnamed protein product [Coffea canephora]|uniref:PNPLA domain-containing protein n=1 Tax=Coffea canephora TaxID=49390 RepID=A0A068TZH3_COFCA|nr:unnamed protein product [Coffea canephora]